MGKGRFQEVTEAAGAVFELSEVSRGAAFGDVDNDGDTDVLILNNSGPARLLTNQVGSGNHWMGLKLVGRPSGRDMLGARVAVLLSQGRILVAPGALRTAATPPPTTPGCWSGWVKQLRSRPCEFIGPTVEQKNGNKYRSIPIQNCIRVAGPDFLCRQILDRGSVRAGRPDPETVRRNRTDGPPETHWRLSLQEVSGIALLLISCLRVQFLKQLQLSLSVFRPPELFIDLGQLIVGLWLVRIQGDCSLQGRYAIV